MKNTHRFEETFRRDLDTRASPATYDRMRKVVLDAHDSLGRVDGGLDVQRSTWKHRLSSRVAPVAAGVCVVAVLLVSWARFAAPAYALEQTVQALRNVRLFHLVTRDDTGVIRDERWIEIGTDGRQVRYRQETPPDFLVVEDGESTAVYDIEKKALKMYDRRDQQYQWVTDLATSFENLRVEGRILEEDAQCQGRRVHKVWWPAMSSECFIDPQTKLPVAIGKTQISYEEPPPGTFVITRPEGYAALDKRPGAVTGSAPQWLVEEDRLRQEADQRFDQGVQALAGCDYAKAIENLEFVVKHDRHRNWAWFWLGRAYDESGRYEEAAEKFTRVIETLGQAYPCYYCYYARGMAYAKLGKEDEARSDLQACLSSMIYTLRTPSTGWLYELADDPRIAQGKAVPGDREIVARMVARLCLITGCDPGFDPNATDQENETAIRAWEHWFKVDGQVRSLLKTAPPGLIP